MLLYERVSDGVAVRSAAYLISISSRDVMHDINLGIRVEITFILALPAVASASRFLVHIL